MSATSLEMVAAASPSLASRGMREPSGAGMPSVRSKRSRSVRLPPEESAAPAAGGMMSEASASAAAAAASVQSGVQSGTAVGRAGASGGSRGGACGLATHGGGSNLARAAPVSCHTSGRTVTLLSEAGGGVAASPLTSGFSTRRRTVGCGDEPASDAAAVAKPLPQRTWKPAAASKP
eukprot:6238957-Prymnesium_polylepis.1